MARLLATALAATGQGVWFDEWELRPGDSLIGGIEEGLANASVFVIIWSEAAAASNWVGTEMRAYLRRRVDDKSLRIIPVMTDDTPLPVLLADYLGFEVDDDNPIGMIAAKIAGLPSEAALIRCMNESLHELTHDADATSDPLPYKRCPECGESSFERRTATDYVRDNNYHIIECKKCGWSNWSE